ncbi:MAG TPA: transglycosylase domain-containing protein [Streptosporangiaceae bacterium]|nr:transglycosylase domain-containing protein [Streptosporangiaceae bacterium]
MSNPDIPAPYRPGQGGSFPSRPGSSDGYGRSSGRSAGGGRHSGHSNRSSRGSRRGGGSPRRGGTAAAGGTRGGVREDFYSPRRGEAPGQDGPRRPGSGDGGAAPWGERSARGRATSRFGTGVRDIRDDLRERLRRNGVQGDWDQPGGRRPRRSGNGSGDWGGPDDPGGKEPRRKGSWWRHWTWKKALTLVAAFIGLMVITATVGVAYAYSKTPIPDVQSAVMQQASKVYFSDGKTEVGQFGQTNRVILTYSQFPATLRDAVVAAEDKNFWHEGGISPTGIVRAAYYDLTSSGGNLQGGSTITQQLVRNYYNDIGTAQTASRKVKEIFVAQKLAQAKSKEWILQQYLNTVYFGGGAYGAAAAAQVYFGLDTSHLSKITAAQAAMIAAMIQSPSYYKPDPNAGPAHAALVYRWKYVLQTMESMGTLSPQGYSAALQKFPTVVPPVNNTWNGYRGYIMQAVLNELETTYHYTLGQINTTGLHVVTTFNQKLMSSLYSTVRQADRLMKHCTPPAILAGQAHVACTGLPRWVRTGAVLEDVHNGGILAMYSGQNYKKTQYDNALQSRNQVGSSFKTYVLATAVKQGMNVQTSILNGDSPLQIPPDSSPTTLAKRGSQSPGPGYYEVVNDESGTNSFGPTKVQFATAVSLNTAYTDLWHHVAYDPATGRHPVTDMAKAFGVDVRASGMVGGPSPMQDEAGIALGQASLTAEEQATTIATLADNGLYHSPHVIKKIIAGNSVTPAKITTRQVLTADQAADVDWALSADTTGGGTAAGLGLDNGQTVIAKTGTTNLSQSAYFMAATPKYAMADAMFVNKPHCPPRLGSECSATSALAFAPPPGVQTLFGVGGMSGYGGQWPAYMWHEYFTKNFENLPVENFLPVNNDGQKWNLYGALPKPKPKHDNQGSHCQGQGQGNPFPFGCKHGQPTPTGFPTPTGGPTPTGNPTPTGHPTPTGPHFAAGSQPAPATGSNGSGGAGAGAVGLALIVVAGPSLPLVTRLRNRRSRARRSAERPPGS